MNKRHKALNHTALGYSAALISFAALLVFPMRFSFAHSASDGMLYGDSNHEGHDYADAEAARQRKEPVFKIRKAAALAATQLNQLGQWSPITTWPFVFASAANLPDGRIIAWGANNQTFFNGGNYTYSAVWDPATNQFTRNDNPTHSMFCGMPTLLEDGRVLVNGGDGGQGGGNNPYTSTFNFHTSTWTPRINQMNAGRWYPGSVALPNGQVFTALGDGGGPYPELWTEGQGWSWLYGINLQMPIINRTLAGDINGSSVMLPYFHLAPNGEIFHSGPTDMMNWIDPTGNGTVTSANLTNAWDLRYSSTIMYDEGKLLQAGGGWDHNVNAIPAPVTLPVSNRAALIDINNANAQKTEVAPMNFARTFHNGVMLPTGEVMMIGGNNTGVRFSDGGAVLTPEIWNPDSQTWRQVAPHSVPRTYHSVALLMTDGRVWSAGGGVCNCAADHPDQQIFSPPYLFNADGSLAARPTITQAPDVVVNGETIPVQASANIQKFSLIKLSSTTHALNSDQRFLNVPFTAIGLEQYQLSLNGNQNVLTPGYWMLFAVNDQGVPSVAKVLQVSSASFILNPVVPVPHESGNSVSYTANATNGNNLRYKWLIGDNTPETAYSTSPTISHTYAQPGVYLVKLTVTDDSGKEKSLTFSQAIHQPLTANRPRSSMNILYEKRNTGNDRIWNINQDNDSVSVFDAVTNTKLAEIDVGKAPRSLAQAPNGNVYVTNKGAATVSVIDPNSLAIVRTDSLPYGEQPFGVLFSPTGNAGYIAFEATGKLLKFDPATGASLGATDVGTTARHLSINADGSKVYVSRFITPHVPGEETANPQANGGGGEVVVVNTNTMMVENTIKLRMSDRQDTSRSGRGIPNYLGPAVISPDGLSAWVPSKQDNILRGALRDGQNLDFQNTVRSINSRIDLASASEDYTARIDFNNGGIASTALYDKSGNYLFVALESSREVSVVDAYSKAERFRIPVGRAPQGLALSDDGQKLYVSNFTDRTVGVYDLSNLNNQRIWSANLLATYNSVGTEKLSPQVLAGKQFFYDSLDPRLAFDKYMSCAACHNDGDQDGRVWDLTGFGEGLRNTIGLQGRAGTAQGLLHWSGNFDEIQDFEGQIRSLAGGTGLMSDAQFNTGTRNQSLGDPKAGISADLDALAAYVTSLNHFAPTPYRNNDGSLTAEAVAGKTVFTNKNCMQCHNGTAFSGSGKVTLFNIGTLKPNSGKRLNSVLTGIDPPSLRDVWASAPYLHDGSAATLSDAIQAHNGASFVGNELDQLVSFMQQIGSEEIILASLATPSLISPTGTVSATAPTFSWQSIPGATSYNLAIANTSNNSSVLTVPYTAARLGCEAPASTCTVKPANLANNGRYTADVQATSTTNSSTWSPIQSFTVASTTPPLTFADNPSTNNPYYTYVNTLAATNVTAGLGDGTFGLNNPVTRGEMAAFIIRALEGEPAACSTDAFADVPAASGFCKYIQRMKERNITNGIGGNLYGINDTVTREQMAAFIMRAIDGNTPGTTAPTCSTSSFGDVPTSNAYCGYIKRLAALGVTKGCTASATGVLANYCPRDTVTRGQMAAFISRAFLGM